MEPGVGRSPPPNRWNVGAGGGSWTHTGLATLRIFLPATAFAAPTQG